MALYTIAVLMNDDSLAFDRTVGVLRRRNLPIASLAVGPSHLPGVSRLTVTLETDRATADQIVKLLHKTSGVRDALTFELEDGAGRELALVRVRATLGRRADLLDTIDLYRATVVDEAEDSVTVEVAGSGSFVLSLLRALEQFGILAIARSGVVALERPAEPTTSAQESAA